MGDLIQLHRVGYRDGRHLRLAALGFTCCAGRRRHQLRAGRVRDAPRLRDAALRRGRRAALARVSARVRGGNAGAGMGFQARGRRSADPSRRHSAGDRHPRAVDRTQIRAEGRLQCRSAPVHEPVSRRPVRARGRQHFLRRRRDAADGGAIVIGLQSFLNKTITGRAMVAVAQNTDAARVLGINVNRMVLYTFLINAVLAVVAALLVTPTYLAKFDMGDSIGRRPSSPRSSAGSTRRAARAGRCVDRRAREPRRILRVAGLQGRRRADAVPGRHPVPSRGLLGKAEERKV